MNKLFFIRAEWDEEAAVWVATSDDVPGLATERTDVKLGGHGLVAKVRGGRPRWPMPDWQLLHSSRDRPRRLGDRVCS